MQKRNTAEKKIKGFMKKGLVLGMVAMMAVSATACGGNDRICHAFPGILGPGCKKSIPIPQNFWYDKKAGIYSGVPVYLCSKGR